MTNWLRRYAANRGPASIRGRLYRIDGYPGAVLTGRPDDRVTGNLYRLARPAETLELLDDYEGCGKRAARPHEFRRVAVDVMRDKGGNIRAWTYLYNLPVRGLEVICSGDFLRG